MSASTRGTALLTVIVALAAMTAAPAQPLAAQARTIRSDTLTPRVRDSLIAVAMADTLETVRRPATRIATSRQTIAVRPTFRSYRVGQINATEQGMATRFASRMGRTTLRVDVTPISYLGDTSAASNRPQVAFSGASPVNARFDVAVRAADTLRVFAQSSSFPGTLRPQDAQAVGAVGTSTIDLDAALLGVAARVGTRYVLTQPIGGDGVSLSLRGGVEYDPKPSGNAVVSWRGTTVRGGLGVSRAHASTTLGASIEMTQSFTDSLGGRNLYPGGGAVTVEARAMRLVGRDGGGLIAFNGFYARPINVQRPDVPTRIIPIGDFFGGTFSAAMPLSSLTLLPVLTVLRESSASQSTSRGTTTTRQGSGQTANASLGLLIPLGRHLSLTPEAGGTIGSVGLTTSDRSALRNNSSSFSDAISGRWFSVELSLIY